MRCTASRAMLAAGLLLAGALVSFDRAADAAPIQFGSNYYEYIPDEAISWNNASAAASASSFMGVNGHLATVTSAGENNFLLGLSGTLPTEQGSWLGGAVDGSQHATWTVGPEAGQPLSFNRFGGIEPNNGPSNIYMNIGTAFAGIATGEWADAANGLSSGSDQIAGYFVEYQVGDVPLPAAFPLMLSGLAGFGILGWRRKRMEMEG